MSFRVQGLICIFLFSNLFGFGVSAESSKDVSVKKEVNRVSLDTKTKQKLISIFKHNEKLHGSFFKYEADKIESLSLEMHDLISKLENKKITEELSAASKKLLLIKKENKRKVNDENYHLLTKALAGVVKKYDLGSTYNIYYCPMLRMKWVQNSKVMPLVHNPFAPEMPHCGGKRSEY